MKAEIWMDFVCPFCYIGKRKFESALEQFPFKGNVQVEFKSYQLDPSASNHSSKSMHEALVEKYKFSLEKAEEMTANISSQAKEVGLDFNFSTMKRTNSFDAHRLMKYAQQHGKESEMIERLFHAYFTESKQIGNHATLIQLAKEVGLQGQGVKGALESNDFITAVRNDQKRAKQIGVNGVPFFVFNEKYAVSGAQPTTAFTEVLEKIWDEERKVKAQFNNITPENAKTTFCTDGTCSFENDKK
ncbi:DsbA family oxidoreductase [Virgibacillus sp. W0181]|uniref:DsbA family oxidoreductase n=1 Tax=Virgibacillus sp. W0181 TaxID=3391581 RepID=UPI003F44F7CD